MEIKETEAKIKKLDLGTTGIKDLLLLVKEVYDFLSLSNKKTLNAQLNDIKADLEFYLTMDKEGPSLIQRQKLFSDSKKNLLEIISQARTH